MSEQIKEITKEQLQSVIKNELEKIKENLSNENFKEIIQNFRIYEIITKNYDISNISVKDLKNIEGLEEILRILDEKGIKSNLKLSQEQFKRILSLEDNERFLGRSIGGSSYFDLSDLDLIDIIPFQDIKRKGVINFTGSNLTNSNLSGTKFDFIILDEAKISTKTLEKLIYGSGESDFELIKEKLKNIILDGNKIESDKLEEIINNNIREEIFINPIEMVDILNLINPMEEVNAFIVINDIFEKIEDNNLRGI